MFTCIAVREAHKAQKALQDQRRAAKPNSSLLVDAKRIWSLARAKTIPAPERAKHVQDLMGVIRGKVKEIVFKHDASRIVQTVVKYGGQKERDEIAVELKGRFKELSQNKYSKVSLYSSIIILFPTESHLVSGNETYQVMSLSSCIYTSRIPEPCPATSPPP
jgi:pumilio homology domain family member 6